MSRVEVINYVIEVVDYKNGETLFRTDYFRNFEQAQKVMTILHAKLTGVSLYLSKVHSLTTHTETIIATSEV